MKMRRLKHRSIEQMETNHWGRWVMRHFVRKLANRHSFREIGTYEAPAVLYVTDRVN